VAAFAVAAAMAAVALPQYTARLASLGEVVTLGFGQGPGLRNADGAIRGRLTEMMAAGLIFADHPVLGAGPGMSEVHYRSYAEIVGGRVRPDERQTHSLYLGFAAEHGMLGLIAFAGVIVTTWRGLQRAYHRWDRVRPERAALAAALLGSLIVYLTTSLFLHASYVRYFWAILALGSVAGVVLAAPEPRKVVSRIMRR
jgi:O-antigen ligase